MGRGGWFKSFNSLIKLKACPSGLTRHSDCSCPRRILVWGGNISEGVTMKNGNKLSLVLSLLVGLIMFGCGSNNSNNGSCPSGQYQSQSYGCVASCGSSANYGLVNNVCTYAPAANTSGALGNCPSNYQGYQLVAGTVQGVAACCAVGYPQTTQYCLPASMFGSQSAGNCQPGYYWNGSSCVP